MLRSMIFIDFENFDISKFNYYRKIGLSNPKLDFNKFPKEINGLLHNHILIKTFLFAPKPEGILASDLALQSRYNWITGMKNQDYFTIIEGRHVAKPTTGYTYRSMNLSIPASYYREEKGTDVNIATHLLTKAFHNSYDTAIIVSGDTDYIPVMDVLNTLGKSVVVVGVNGQNLVAFKHHTDKQIILDDSFFQKCLR